MDQLQLYRNGKDVARMLPSSDKIFPLLALILSYLKLIFSDFDFQYSP